MERVGFLSWHMGVFLILLLVVWFGASHINFLKGDKKILYMTIMKIKWKEKRLIEGIYAKCLAQNTVHIRWVEKDAGFIYFKHFQGWHFSYKYDFLLPYMCLSNFGWKYSKILRK